MGEARGKERSTDGDRGLYARTEWAGRVGEYGRHVNGRDELGR